MIELRWITCSKTDKNGNYIPEAKQLQYRVLSPSPAPAGWSNPGIGYTTPAWTKWMPVKDVGWEWQWSDTETT